jgi:hypothetical protein
VESELIRAASKGGPGWCWREPFLFWGCLNCREFLPQNILLLADPTQESPAKLASPITALEAHLLFTMSAAH